MPRRLSRFQFRLLLICVAALAVRLIYVFFFMWHTKLWGDAYVYHWQAYYLLHGKGFIVPYQANYHGHFVAAADEPPLWTLTIAGFDLLGLTTYNEHKILACFLGVMTVAALGVLGRRLGGERVGLIAAGIAAVYSNFWVNDGIGQSETLLLLALVMVMLAAYHCWEAPTWRRGALLGLACGISALIHPETLLLAPLLGIPMLWRVSGTWRRRVGLVAAVGVVCALTIAPWIGRNLAQFDKPVFLSDGADVTLAATNCDPAYKGGLLGYWSITCVNNGVKLPPGDESDQFYGYRKEAFTYMRAHASRVPIVMLARLGREWNVYKPIQMTHLDVIEGRQLRVNQYGLVSYYALMALGLVGAVALHRRRVPLWPLLSLAVTSAVAAMLAFGNTRYRVASEIALAIFAAAGIDALVWRPRRHEASPAPPAPARPVIREAAVTAGAVSTAAHAAPGPEGDTALVEPPAHRGPQFPCVDGLRGIAAVTVLMVHASFASGFTPKNPHTWGPYMARLEIGVSVFFLISGFLLYRPYVDAALTGRARPDTRSFYKRRLLRIVPAYWVALTITAYVFHDVKMGGGFAGFFIHYGFLQIYFPASALKGIGQAWSLCTELGFYAILPLYAWSLARRPRSPREQLRVEFIGLAVLIAINVAFRVYIFTAAPVFLRPVMPNWLLAYLDLFAAGMFLAVVQTWFHHHGTEPALLARRWVPWLCWGLALVCFWAVSNLGLPYAPIVKRQLGHDNFERQALYGLFAFFLLVPAVFGPQDQGAVRRFLRLRPIVYMGVVSYGIYIWHEEFITWYRNLTNHKLFSQPLIPLTLVTVALSVGVATLSYRWVEMPFLRLKDRRLFPSIRSRSPRPEPAGAEQPAPTPAPTLR